MNKKGADKFLSIYWFFIIFLVSGAVIYMAALFYGSPYDVREIEASILTDRIADCLTNKGYLNTEVFSSDFKQNFSSKCHLNFETEDFSDGKTNNQYYFEARINEFSSDTSEILGNSIFEFSGGNVNLKTEYLIENPEKERAGREIDMVVLHYSVTPSVESTIEVLEQRKLSIHYVVGKDGFIASSSNTESSGVVGEEEVARHAGCRVSEIDAVRVSCKGPMPEPGEICCVNVNPKSIGIEIVNMGNEEYTPEQIAALENLVSGIVSRYNIPIDRGHIVGHYQVAPGFKVDPGDLFPWETFMSNIRNEGGEIGLGRKFYTIDNSGNPYVVEILTFVGKVEKNA